jgi:hypothetical protein
MRPRAGTQTLTLEPSCVAEILALARQHDEQLKEARQDLFRAETKLSVERTWKWPIRMGCVALGAGTVLAFQNQDLRAAVVDFGADSLGRMRSSGVEVLVTFLLIGAVIFGLTVLIRRLIAGPSPEQKARKLMEQFARADGVAAYVFSEHDSTEEEAAAVGALTRPENKKMRQRRLTSSNRLLTASITRLLNQSAEDVERDRLRQLN